MLRSHTIPATFTVAVLALGVAACGGDDEEEAASTPAPTEKAAPAAGGGLAIAAPADGALRFEPQTLEATSGKVTLAFDNPSQVPHAVEVEGNGIEEETETVTAGKASLALDLEAGTYELYCPVGNHRDAGMTGTITVR